MTTRKSLARVVRYKDLLETSGAIALDLWASEDPQFSYEADACDVLAIGREITLLFGQTVVGTRDLATAVAMSMTREAARDTLKGFGPIAARIEEMRFTEEEYERFRIDRKSIPKSSRAYRRERAQVVRGICGDDMAVIDFYWRPLITKAVIEARANQPLELTPVMRLTCHPGILGLAIRLLSSIVEEEPR